MTKVSFTFGIGSWCVQVPDDKLSVINLLLSVQEALKTSLPHRVREVEQFLIPCVMEILQSK